MNKEIEDIDDFSHLKHKALKKALLVKYIKYYGNLLDNGVFDEILPIMKEINNNKKK